MKFIGIAIVLVVLIVGYQLLSQYFEEKNSARLEERAAELAAIEKLADEKIAEAKRKQALAEAASSTALREEVALSLATSTIATTTASSTQEQSDPLAEAKQEFAIDGLELVSAVQNDSSEILLLAYTGDIQVKGTLILDSLGDSETVQMVLSEASRETLPVLQTGFLRFSNNEEVIELLEGGDSRENVQLKIRDLEVWRGVERSYAATTTYIGVFF